MSIHLSVRMSIRMSLHTDRHYRLYHIVHALIGVAVVAAALLHYKPERLVAKLALPLAL